MLSVWISNFVNNITIKVKVFKWFLISSAAEQWRMKVKELQQRLHQLHEHAAAEKTIKTLSLHLNEAEMRMRGTLTWAELMVCLNLLFWYFLFANISCEIIKMRRNFDRLYFAVETNSIFPRGNSNSAVNGSDKTASSINTLIYFLIGRSTLHSPAIMEIVIQYRQAKSKDNWINYFSFPFSQNSNWILIYLIRQWEIEMWSELAIPFSWRIPKMRIINRLVDGREMKISKAVYCLPLLLKFKYSDCCMEIIKNT